ncbi:hypothetical protein Q8A73_009789 [Channa argus]|nr:hypothetical protein Q8A73_009789 [Channa argus]
MFLPSRQAGLGRITAQIESSTMNCRNQHKSAGPCQAPTDSAEDAGLMAWQRSHKHKLPHTVPLLSTFPPPFFRFDPTTLNPPSARRHGRQAATQTAIHGRLMFFVSGQVCSRCSRPLLSSESSKQTEISAQHDTTGQKTAGALVLLTTQGGPQARKCPDVLPLGPEEQRGHNNH